jgi:hypothetical protein
VFSVSYAGPPGHTGVVLGVEQDGSLIIGQAGYCSSDGNVAVIPEAEWTGQHWTFTDVSSLLTDPGMKGSAT